MWLLSFYNILLQNRIKDTAKKWFAVHPERKLFCIFSIISSLFRFQQLIPSIFLCQAKQSGFQLIRTVFMPQFQQSGLIRQCWTWANKRHISPQNVKNLRQFIQTGFPQEFSQRCNMRNLCMRNVVGLPLASRFPARSCTKKIVPRSKKNIAMMTISITGQAGMQPRMPRMISSSRFP